MVDNRWVTLPYSQFHRPWTQLCWMPPTSQSCSSKKGSSSITFYFPESYEIARLHWDSSILFALVSYTLQVYSVAIRKCDLCTVDLLFLFIRLAVSYEQKTNTTAGNGAYRWSQTSPFRSISFLDKPKSWSIHLNTYHLKWSGNTCALNTATANISGTINIISWRYPIYW